MKLTNKNYFSPSNTAISNSKVKDFLVGKEYYYHKHIKRDHPASDSEALKIGSILDKIAQQGTVTHFKRFYQVAVKKSENADRFTKQKTKNPDHILTNRQYDLILGMAEKMINSPWYKSYGRNTQSQVALWDKFSDVGICGLLDWLTIDGDTAYIDDLKTAPNDAIFSTTSWFHQCKRFDYFRQMAVYKYLVHQSYPNVKKVVCRHAVIGKDAYHPTRLFVIPDEFLEEPLKEFFSVATEITHTKDWIPRLPDWTQAQTLDIELEY